MMTFAGVIPILATPFHDDERLDLESWQRLIEFMVGLGVDGITILGVLGESNRLTDEERAQLIEAAVSVVKRRVPKVSVLAARAHQQGPATVNGNAATAGKGAKVAARDDKCKPSGF